MKCSFCEQPLACKSCGHLFQPRLPGLHLGAYHPDEEVLCPACQHVLACRACGYVYGDADAAEDEGQPNE